MSRFYKYVGAGNDFIMVDMRSSKVDDKISQLSSTDWALLCDRHNGIGADGVIKLHDDETYDFSMEFLNSDGGEVEFCGNGARAIALLAHDLGIVPKLGKAYEFKTLKSTCKSIVNDPSDIRILVNDIKDLGAIDVSDLGNASYVFCGVPHTVIFLKSKEELDQLLIDEVGKKIRYDKRYENGTNVNFAFVDGNEIYIRTYERGVEGETLACGSGSTATALALRERVGGELFILHTLGGDLKVKFDGEGVWLIGPAKRVFTGEI